MKTLDVYCSVREEQLPKDGKKKRDQWMQISARRSGGVCDRRIYKLFMRTHKKGTVIAIWRLTPPL